jgi:hypothetical protein
MPRISEFFGIAIYMYWFDNQKHKMPHFHARYQGVEAVFDLSGNCIEGSLGNRAEKLVGEWCSENKTDIQIAWKAATSGKELPWVSPLR